MDTRQPKRGWAYAVHHAIFATVCIGIAMIVVGIVYVDPHNSITWRKMGARSFYFGWAVIGTIGGAKLIHQIVRRINRRDDPQTANRPPDPP